MINPKGDLPNMLMEATNKELKTQAKPDCVESIWIKNGRIQRLAYHQQRYKLTMLGYFGKHKCLDLRDFISTKAIEHDDVKCRLVYNADGVIAQYLPYQRREINSVKVIHHNTIEYPVKTLERLALDLLHGQKGTADEIIICKNGLITDAYYFNVVLENEMGLFTPRCPLLPGIQRQYLLEKFKINPKDIKIEDVESYHTLHLINALNPLGYVTLPLEKVIF